MACWPSQEEYSFDDYSRVPITPSRDSRDSTAAGSEDTEIRHVDYRRVTPLFRHIERENWEGVLTFLNTGRWTSSMLTSSNDHLRCPVPEIQVKTWVTSYDRKGKPEWSQLPLHAAISYNAPFVVVQKLLQLYPNSVHCTDNEGMLPIHLAFGFGAQENVLALLMDPFPGSINEKGLGDRYPYQCCELGPNKVRGVVFKTVTDQVIRRAKEEAQSELKKFAKHAAETVGVTDSLDLSEKPLTDFILELLKDRKELQDLKEKGPPSTSASASAKTTTTASISSSPKSETNRSANAFNMGYKMKSKTPSISNASKPKRSGSVSRKFRL